MSETQVPENQPENPVFSISGVMPGANEAAWKTAYPNPDAELHPRHAAGHGPSFSMAGVTTGESDSHWHTAMPDPTRDTLDAYGHVITKVEAAARAELAGPGALALHAAKVRAESEGEAKKDQPAA